MTAVDLSPHAAELRKMADGLGRQWGTPYGIKREGGVPSTSGMVGLLVLDRTTELAIYVEHFAFSLQERVMHRRCLTSAPRALALDSVLQERPHDFNDDPTVWALMFADASTMLGELPALPRLPGGTWYPEDVTSPVRPPTYRFWAGMEVAPNTTYDWRKIHSGGPSVDLPTAVALAAQLVDDGVYRAIVVTSDAISVEAVP